MLKSLLDRFFAHLSLAAAIFSFISSLATTPSWSADNLAPKYVSIPVYYLTDRERKGEGFGSRRRYPEHCMHEMYYGTSFVNVPNAEKRQSSESEFNLLGWKGADHKAPKFAPKEMIDAADGEEAKKQFFARLKKALNQSGQSDLCVFVHGACDAFEDCAQDAATMGYYLQKPVILYSWPSNPKWRSYFVDGTNNEWSQGHFNTFCKDMIDFQTKTPMHVIFVSHSMGNRLVIRSVPFSYGKGLVSAWELISPDTDADTTRHYIMGLTPDKSMLRLYVSNKDKMLPLAQMLSGGYYRTGEAANKVVLPQGWNPAEASRMQRIDFTTIDKGRHGHSIPFSLVSSIVRNDKPPAGLELVPETEVRANRLVRIANRSEKLSDTTGGLPNNFCKRVVKIQK